MHVWADTITLKSQAVKNDSCKVACKVTLVTQNVTRLLSVSLSAEACGNDETSELEAIGSSNGCK